MAGSIRNRGRQPGRKFSARVEEKGFIPIERHCAQLAGFTYALHEEGLMKCPVDDDEPVSLDDAGDWLRLACEISGVQLNPYMFSEDGLYCDTAADYDEARSELHEEAVLIAMRFQFVWLAFEIICRCAEVPPDPRAPGSKAKAACLFLRTADADAALFPGYFLMTALTSYLRKWPQHL